MKHELTNTDGTVVGYLTVRMPKYTLTGHTNKGETKILKRSKKPIAFDLSQTEYKDLVRVTLHYGEFLILDLALIDFEYLLSKGGK